MLSFIMLSIPWRLSAPRNVSESSKYIFQTLSSNNCKCTWLIITNLSKLLSFESISCPSINKLNTFCLVNQLNYHFLYFTIWYYIWLKIILYVYYHFWSISNECTSLTSILRFINSILWPFNTFLEYIFSWSSFCIL